MRKQPRHLIGAPPLKYRIREYTVSRKRAKGIGNLEYTFSCTVCGIKVSRVFITGEDYTRIGKCTHSQVVGFIEINIFKAYILVLKGIHRGLVKRGRSWSIDPKIVRFRGFLKAVINLTNKYDVVINPASIEIIAVEHGFRESNLAVEEDFFNNWGGKENLIKRLEEEIKSGRK